MAKKKPGDTVEARLEQLEGKAATAEKWIWVIVTLAAILGLGGTQLWLTLKEANSVAAQAKTTAESARQEASVSSETMKSEGRKVLDDLRPVFNTWVAEARDQLKPQSGKMYSLWVTKAPEIFH